MPLSARKSQTVSTNHIKRELQTILILQLAVENDKFWTMSLYASRNNIPASHIRRKAWKYISARHCIL